jgi:hypothetical protein
MERRDKLKQLMPWSMKQMKKNNAENTPTPGRKMARTREKRIKRRMLFIVILMVSGYLAVTFMQLGYKYRVSLDKQENSMRQMTKALDEKKQRLTDQIQNSQSIEGRKDQMHKTGSFEENEVPIIMSQPKPEKDNNVKK